MKRILLGALITILILSVLGTAMFFGKETKLLVKQLIAPDIALLEAQIDIYEDQIYNLHIQIWGLKGIIRKQERDFGEREKVWTDRIEELLTNQAEFEKQRQELLKQLEKEVNINWDNLKDFESMNELLAFLSEVDIYKLWYEPEDLDCDDYTKLLMRTAAEKGYRLLPFWGFTRMGNSIVAWHTMNYAIVKDYIAGQGEIKWVVLIEPQSGEFLILGAVDKPETWKDKIINWMP